MTIKELNKYRGYKKELSDLENRLSNCIEVTTVSGSSPEFPYIKRNHKVEGLTDKHLKQLQDAKTKSNTELLKLSSYIDTVTDPLLRTVFRLRFIDGLRWEAIADKIEGYTVYALKKQVYRYLKCTHMSQK